MSYGTIATIVRREVRETLGDWRILTPIVVLTFLMPLLLVSGGLQVVRFLEDPNSARGLMPIAALIVGFVPASFSLITALESFVGERERNTLESLLAMPISDRELYLSKLCSSLATPVSSGIVAVLLFTAVLALADGELFVASITLDRLLLIFTLVISLALAMVSSAVIISSHITTIRAANLMSSFVLIPAAGLLQLAASLIIGGRWGSLWLLALATSAGAGVLVRLGMATFNREEILSREHKQGDLSLFIAGLRRRLQGAPRPPRSLGRVGPVQAILVRELRDTVSDWRVLAPLFLLVVVIPLGLVSAGGFAIDFVDGDLASLTPLVPFITLLVGFIPSSFALITALESFVGEHERNTLESLLAMPISDRQLYAGKLLASVVLPMVASVAAMVVFMVGLAAAYPQLFYPEMLPERIALLLAMIVVLTVMLVAGAVVISSHTTSVRAATLMASALLVPTAVLLQLTALLFVARRWAGLGFVPLALGVVAVALIRTGLKTFNREDILSREHEQLSLADMARDFGRFFREHRPAGTAPEGYAGLPFSPARFYRSELPALLAELRLPLLTALASVAGGLALGWSYGLSDSIRTFDFLIRNIGTAPPPSGGLAAYVFLNNLRVSVLSNLFSAVSFGLFAFLVPFIAFAQIGFVSGTLVARGGSWASLAADSPTTFLLAYVTPHGIIELPTFILCAALGLRIGAAVLSPPPGFTVARNLLWSFAAFAKLWLLVIAPLVLAGALIEGFLTPVIVRALY